MEVVAISALELQRVTCCIANARKYLMERELISEETVLEQKIRLLREVFPSLNAEIIVDKLLYNQNDVEAAMNSIMKYPNPIPFTSS